ncbi:MAG TPA: phosphatidylglycerol lysyltransferase domain-containing protein, partial [Geminicoccaceae bacterium]|nr:phosphatidylglycerol lysyltransferase domain-containing protein [Geminicoccaceae bacterium]
FPVGVVRREGRVVAFANLWLSADREECGVDLMRFTRDMPYGTMDYLFLEIMLWAQAQGYRWFDLGMAPLSGLPDHRLAPLWSRLGRLMFRHGAQFYNFQGLRAYKDKFGPVWEPAYLLCPRLGLAPALADVAALISGGWLGMIRK